MTTNFDIYSIINKASSEYRAAILFDALLNMSILNKRRFKIEEIEALSNSFKSSNDAKLYDVYLHNSVCTLFMIAAIEKEIIEIEYLVIYLRFYHLSQDDIFSIDYLIAKTSKDLQEVVDKTNKKQIKKAFEELLKNIRDLCFVSFNDRVIKKFGVSVNRQENEGDLENEDHDFYHEIFVNFFSDSIAKKVKVAKEFLELLKTKYGEFEVKFEVVGDKIEELGSSLKRLELLKLK